MNSLRDALPAAIERPTTLIREQVAAYLRDAITSFQLKPGTLLVEREICAATGTSRATVREALRQLESEGMVVSEVGKGTVVASLTKDEARNIYQVRGVLEGLATRLFTNLASDAQVGRLADIVAAMGELTGDPARMLEAKTEFYDVLFDGAGNDELRRLWAATRRRATLVRASSLSIPGRPEQSLGEIRAIMDAITARDADLAAERSSVHIDLAATAILGAEDSFFAAASPHTVSPKSSS